MNFVELPGNRCPANGAAVALKAEDGVRLRAAHWSPGAKPAGTVFLLNGRSEFIDKYFEAASRLLARSYRVFALDWRGQGLSDRLLADPQKGHVESFVDYERDLRALIAFAESLDAPRPFLVLAHSMGGHHALRFALRNAGTFDGLALCAPMLRIPLPGLRIAIETLIHALSWTAPQAYAPGQGPLEARDLEFPGNRLCSDPVRFQVLVDSLMKEPGLRLGGVTNRWLAQAFRSMAWIRREMHRMRTPTLIVSALADRIVDSAIHPIAARSMNARLVAIEGAQHEILREADRFQDQLWSAFDEWRSAF